VSCKIISRLEEDKTIPVNPPVVNKKIKPRHHSIIGINLNGEP
jgi:hypothetical protein